MSFAAEQIELSMCSPETGLPLTANVYTLEGVNEVDGTPRKMSIGQLVMAICLQRAAALEEQVVQLMDAINRNSMLLEGLTDVEKKLVDVAANGRFNTRDTFTYDGASTSYYEFLTKAENQGGPGLTVPDERSDNNGKYWNYADVQSVISLIEDKMDSLNTVSQDTLIELQSLTTKRDQTYDLVSNVLKSLHTVLVGTVNNL